MWFLDMLERRHLQVRSDSSKSFKNKARPRKLIKNYDSKCTVKLNTDNRVPLRDNFIQYYNEGKQENLLLQPNLRRKNPVV